MSPGKNFLVFDREAGLGGGRGEKIRHALLTSQRRSGFRERGIHAGKRDQFGEELGGVSHRKMVLDAGAGGSKKHKSVSRKFCLRLHRKLPVFGPAQHEWPFVKVLVILK